MAIALRRNYLLKIPDAFIVATEHRINGILITNDKKLLSIKWPGLKAVSLLE
jgi:predicted nucleic acid-binding protein